MQGLFKGNPKAAFKLRLWDGTEATVGEDPKCTLIFRDEATFSHLIRTQDSYQFCVAFVEDRFDIEGDMFAALRLRRALKDVDPGFVKKLQVLWKLGLVRSRHTTAQDKKNVQAHYDVSNDFYKLFLDKSVMAYSCAYYHTPDESLEDAQTHKVDLICRKLRLKEGETFLDIGCGWGGLLMHAAKHYGVKAHGVTLSQAQYDLATQRVKEAGLSDKITIELRDYRELADASFDKIASVGMYEHVGIAEYPTYFATMHRLLKEGGLFLNHGITRKKGARFTGEAQFIFAYIFPSAEIDDISHTQVVMEGAGFELLNMECLRPHYEKTLTEWAKRLMANEEAAKAMVPKDIYRAWKLYLAGLPLAFEDGGVSICQVLGSKKQMGPANVPLTMKDVYCGTDTV